MEENNKTYRVHTKVREDKFLDVNINQDIGQIEILSLKLDVENFYKLHTSNYGCLVGRVLANQGVGVPNVKISVFIPVESADMENPIFRYLYPYSNTKSKDENGVRYNLLPDVVDDKCHQDIGTFPNKRLVLDDENVVEVFDKYFKYTTVSNASGDYMLFGIPVGTNIIHSELDLSDIGILSQKPRDLYYKGYNHTQFENSSQFKKSTNLDYLTQVMVQDNPVQVYSFWGDDETGEYEGVDAQVKITRSDIDINYKFEPTCIFIGSLVADDKSNGFSKKCTPTERSGKMDRLTTGTGTIEMIRKTPDGGVESFSVQGNDLIDGNGTWCYQIPMNLDYVKTDEYGNLVPAENEMTGIPTRTRVRFRVSLADYESDTASAHLPKVLVPNNPTLDELQEQVKVKVDDSHYIVIPQGPDYNFGTYTREESFRDLFWNNVYTVKQYIPRIQNIIFEGRHVDRNKNFSGIKAVNVNGSNNPIPYNNIRVNLTFLFIFQCIIFKAVVLIVKILNKLIYIMQAAFDALACRGGLDNDSCGCASGGKCDANLLYITLDGSMCPTMEGYQMALGARGTSDNNSAKRLVIKTCDAGGAGGTDIKGTFKQTERDGVDDESFYMEGEDNPTSDKVNRDPNVDPKASDSKYANSQLPDMYSDKNQGAPTENQKWVSESMVSASANYFVKCVELQFAMEYEVIQFDFYNDWLNGVIYLPRWFAELKRKKRIDYVNACNENYRGMRELVQQCAVYYDEGDSLYYGGSGYSRTASTCGDVCHRKTGRRYLAILNKFTPDYNEYNLSGTKTGTRRYPDGGIIQTFKNRIDDKYLYYLRPSKVLQQINTGTTVKANMFATDIVLLGSVTDCNSFGIPTAEGYPSSTFSMPPPTGQLLSDSQEMGIYYAQDSAYYVDKDHCFITQNKRNPDQSKEEYEQLQLEMSGIDWGYNPFKIGDTDNTALVHNQQGGHFLEIGCVAADVTPKSCLNLQRVCELGSEMAQSHSYRTSVSDVKLRDEYDTRMFFPTMGVVSTREIIGEDMRAKFASLNSNRLRTMKDNATGYPMYKLVGYTPTTFNGGFNGWFMNWDLSETRKFITDIADGRSRSYVAFRFADNISPTSGIGYEKVSDKSAGGIRDKCLWKQPSTNEYTIPVYENSFYFYFGLRDGNTAIDRLYTEYFSECANNSEVEEGEASLGTE